MSNEELRFDHSVVTIEQGGAGTIARVDTGFAVYYAGPLPRQTVDALRKVGEPR